jgi:hypothetical protein
MEKQTQARPNWILIIAGLLSIFYGILCGTTIIPNGFHKDFGFVFIGLGIVALYWGLTVSRTKKKVILNEKIMVTEEPGVLRRFVGITVSLAVAFGLLIEIMLMIGPNVETTWIGGQPYVFGGTIHMLAALFYIIGGSTVAGLLLGMAIIYLGRRKVLVTPRLAVGEKNPTFYDEAAGQMILYYNVGVVFGSIIRSLAGRSNFILSDEGIVFYRASGLTLARWRKFKSFESNRETGEFKLKRIINKVSIFSQQQFDDVNKILSDHIKTSPA